MFVQHICSRPVINMYNARLIPNKEKMDSLDPSGRIDRFKSYSYIQKRPSEVNLTPAYKPVD